MNFEKLEQIAGTLSKLNKEAEVIQSLDAMANSLNSYINGPNASHLAEFNAALEALAEKVKGEAWISLPRTWLIYLDEIGFTPFLGGNLVEQIRSETRVTEITAAQARDKINAIKERLDRFIKAFDQIVAAGSTLRVPEDTLEPGTAELAVLMPRSFFHNELREFAKQAAELDRIVGVISELATGSRESPQIRQLSTTDPIFFLLLKPAAALFFLKVLNGLLEAYERVLKIRKLRVEIAAAQLSQDTMNRLEEDAQRKIDEAIAAMIPKLLEQAKLADENRKNELRTELERALPALALRLDNGFRIEATIQPLPKPKEGEVESQDVANLRDLSAKVAELSNKVRQYELIGEPILNLPRPGDAPAAE